VRILLVDPRVLEMVERRFHPGAHEEAALRG
jgi:hypothetical protein